eukprot:gnl/Dysnectes_brevis/291_a324_8602.p2 GENE.gnl/Dysnectes_brevis/291_a324_8602~~gnl/Dysnectes_brevis/291_a324_8602.p2  ORF type:complete len:123 (-),score=32.31 gnl/Dysnectes_brevis/291_a324_8602:90-419(-)
MHGRPSPRHVYSLNLHNELRVPMKVTVTYQGPKNTHVVEHTIAPGVVHHFAEFKRQVGSMVVIFNINKIHCHGPAKSVELHGPFHGVLSPTRNHRMAIRRAPNGALQLH